MTTYVYESVAKKSGGKPRYYEIKQSMKDSPLTKHPETGEEIRRVMVGGFGAISPKGGAEKPAAHRHSSGCGCHPGGCCG